MITEPTITVSGNLVRDPELRYTAGGNPVAGFTVASNPRFRDSSGEWQDGETVYVKVTAWREEAENVAESLRRGDPVIVIGRMRAEVWTDQHGQNRRDHTVTADAVAVPLARHRVRLVKVTREARGQEPGPDSGQEPGPATGEPEPGNGSASGSGPQEPAPADTSGTGRSPAAGARSQRGRGRTRAAS